VKQSRLDTAELDGSFTRGWLLHHAPNLLVDQLVPVRGWMLESEQSDLCGYRSRPRGAVTMASIRIERNLTPVAFVAVVGWALGACGSPREAGEADEAGSASLGTDSGTAGSGEKFDLGGGGDGGGSTPGEGCVGVSSEATLEKGPVDIVFVVDNSDGMHTNIFAVQDNINENFASIIAASGVDYRVILISEHGKAEGDEAICISGPLSATTCDPIPPMPGQNPPVFFHYSLPVSSHDTFCLLLDTFDGTEPDLFGVAPDGWSEWLRPDALRVFVTFTNDSVNCTGYDDPTEPEALEAAETFEAALFAKSPEHFGDGDNPNFVWHAVAGMVPNDPPNAAWLPADPIQSELCDTAKGAGMGYQALSIRTGGLRYPVCEWESYDVIFNELAKGIIESSEISCSFPVPDPPPGETIDIDTVSVEYFPPNGGPKIELDRVDSLAQCTSDSFYLENDVIHLCPETCASVNAGEEGGKIVVLFDCVYVAG
jgi:hypothetical protein